MDSNILARLATLISNTHYRSEHYSEEGSIQETLSIFRPLSRMESQIVKWKNLKDKGSQYRTCSASRANQDRAVSFFSTAQPSDFYTRDPFLALLFLLQHVACTLEVLDMEMHCMNVNNRTLYQLLFMCAGQRGK